MSTGIIHARLSKQLSIPSSLLLGIIVYPFTGFIGSLSAFIFSIIGFIIGLWINPDSDQFGIVTSEWWIIRKFSILGWFIVGLFDPYARIIPYHRHWLSHGFLIGTCFRLLYIFCLLWTFSWFVPVIKSLSDFLWQNWDIILYFSYALFIVDTGHILLDFIIPFREWYETL